MRNKNHYLFNSGGFNRYMVECECVTRGILSFLMSVLIDTWWNVNNVHAYIINRMSVF